MKSKYKWPLIMLVFLGVVTIILVLALRNPTSQPAKNQTSKSMPVTSSPSSFDVYVATDMHYLSPSLHDGGTAFQKYIESGDSKLLQYSDELMDAWTAQVITDHPQAVILSGDLTNNGEQASHIGLAEKLEHIERAGIQVLVIPGNHDILNPWARSFKGESQYKTDYITDKEFREIYNSFGYGEALDSDQDSLSYVAKITDQLWVLMLDTSQYLDNLELGYPKTNGGISASTLKWISEQAKSARSNGAEVIAVMHHNLLEHTVFSMGFTLDNAEQVFNVLNDSKIYLALSGHIHIQDIRSYDGITDIATSALEVYPYQFGALHFDTGASTVDYQTKSVDVEHWSRQNKVKNEDLKQFNEYGKAFFHSQSFSKAADGLKDQGFTEQQIKDMAEAMAELNLHYFAGTVNEMDENVLNSVGMKLWEQAESQFLSRYVQSMADSAKENNQIQIQYSDSSP